MGQPSRWSGQEEVRRDRAGDGRGPHTESVAQRVSCFGFTQSWGLSLRVGLGDLWGVRMCFRQVLSCQETCTSVCTSAFLCFRSSSP